MAAQKMPFRNGNDSRSSSLYPGTNGTSHNDRLIISLPLLKVSFFLTLASNSARISKCRLRSVARIASMTRKRKRLNSPFSRLTSQLYCGLDSSSLQAEAAWWLSNTDRSLYRIACNKRFYVEALKTSPVRWSNFVCYQKEITCEPVTTTVPSFSKSI